MEDVRYQKNLPTPQTINSLITSSIQHMTATRRIKKTRLTHEEISKLFSGSRRIKNLKIVESKHKLRSDFSASLKYLENSNNTKENPLSRGSRKRILNILQNRKRKRREQESLQKLSPVQIDKLIKRSKLTALEGIRLFSNLEILAWKIEVLLKETNPKHSNLVDKPNFYQIKDQSSLDQYVSCYNNGIWMT